MSLNQVISTLFQDKIISVGGGISVPTFLAGISAEELHTWLKIYATFAGGLGSTLVVIYTAIRIHRIIKNKEAVE